MINGGFFFLFSAGGYTNLKYIGYFRLKLCVTSTRKDRFMIRKWPAEHRRVLQSPALSFTKSKNQPVNTKVKKCIFFEYSRNDHRKGRKLRNRNRKLEK